MKKNSKLYVSPELYQEAMHGILIEMREIIKASRSFETEYYDSSDVKRLMNISDSTLHRMRKAGEIPFIKFGRKIVYPKSFFNNAFK